MSLVPDRPALVALAALLLVTAGCASPVTTMGEDEPAPPTGDQAAAAFTDVRSLNATVVWHYDRPDENETVERRIVARPGTNKLWVKTLAPSDRAGNVQASNGSVIWHYNATRNHAVVRQYEGGNRTALVAKKLAYIFDRLNGTRETDRPAPSVGVSPLPVVPSGDRGNVSLANVSLEYGGIETVAGRRAHVVRIRADESRTGLLRQTIWFDTETFYQLRAETAFVADGNVTRITQRVTQVSFGEPIPADRFRFDPPPNATVERAGSIDVDRYPTRAALAANASMRLPDPDLSGTFTFTEGRYIVSRTDGKRDTTTTQIFTRGVNSVFVIKSTDTTTVENISVSDSVRPVTVGDQQGYFLERPRSVLWTCEGHRYQVVGPRLPRDQILRVAESVACE